MPRLLVIDDDIEVRGIIQAYGESAGWAVAGAATAAAGLAALGLEGSPPDVIVLDLMLPDRSGWDVLTTIRQRSDVYILMLTGRGAETERILGLTRGADDYLVKPFSPGELLARCQALLRRPRGAAGGAPTTTTDELRLGPLVVDTAARRVALAGAPIEFTALEFSLLHALARHPGRVFTRGQLVAALWGDAYAGYERVIDVHVGHVRKKLGDDPDAPRFIETVRGVGYRFLPAAAERP